MARSRAASRQGLVPVHAGCDPQEASQQPQPQPQPPFRLLPCPCAPPPNPRRRAGTNSVDCGGKGGSLDGGAKGKKTNVLWVASSTPPPLPEGAAAPAPKEQGSCTSSNSSTASNGAAPGPACNGAAAPGTGRAAGGSGSNSRGSSPLRTSIGSSPKGGLKKRHGSFTGGFRSGLRLMEVSDRQHRIMTVFDPHDPLSMLEDHPHWSLRAEVIPPAQVCPRGTHPPASGGRRCWSLCPGGPAFVIASVRLCVRVCVSARVRRPGCA